MHGCQPDYLPPTVEEYGDLRHVTGAVHLLIGAAAAQDLSFSSPDGSVSSGQGSGGVGGVSGSSGPTTASGGGGTGGTTGGGGTGGGGGGGKGLPFTGL